MTTPTRPRSNATGRFVTANVAAAELLLETAVGKARAIICDGPFGFEAAVETLTNATHAADLLLAGGE